MSRLHSRTRVQLIGGVSAIAHTAVAAIHLVWLKSPWPLGTWPEWSRAFGGENFRVSDVVMATVALLFLSAGYVVAAQSALLPRIGPAWLYRVGTWGIAIVLTLRAVLGFAEMSRSFLNPLTPALFRETILLYLAVYLPVFLILGLTSGYVALRTERQS